MDSEKSTISCEKAAVSLELWESWKFDRNSCETVDLEGELSVMPVSLERLFIYALIDRKATICTLIGTADDLFELFIMLQSIKKI